MYSQFFRMAAIRSIVIVFLLLSFNLASTAKGQPPRRRQPPPPVPELQVGLPPIRVDAVAGEPFGVGVAEIPLDSGVKIHDPLRIVVNEQSNRLFYPTSSVRQIELVLQPVPQGRPFGRGGLIDRLRTAIREGRERGPTPKAITIYFLFRGREPFELLVDGDTRHQLNVTPRLAPLEHREFLENWWESYTGEAKSDIERGNVRPLLPLYLTSMLQSRLKLPAVQLPTGTGPGAKPLEEPLSTLALLAGIEPLRGKLLLEAAQGTSSDAKANLPLPMEPRWIDPVLPPVEHSTAEETIEPLASHVPPECFYIRFGNFPNYLWFQRLSSQYGGDIAQMVTLRALTFDSNARIETTLNTKTTLVSKLFGDSVIEDMAIIGRDLYLQEGGSLGVLFRAKNRKLLASSLANERQTTAKALANDGCTLRDIEISGRKVSFLSTPDNRVRSFLVEDGPYILVTTSRHLVERFVAVSEGAPALGTSPAFRFARETMPEEKKYSVFAFFSPDFFRALVGPRYQIELRRRLDAIARLEMVELAQQVAKIESLKGETIDDLINSGLLPRNFHDRADGGQVLRDGNRWIDSIRGGRGHFLPITDVEVTQVSAAESARYSQQAQFYQDRWQQMDPLIAGVRRFALPDHADREIVTIEGFIAPFEAEKYGWIASLLGPPTPTEIRLPADDMASVQVHLRGKAAFQTTDHHLFAGVKDMIPPDPDETKGLLQTILALRRLPGYLGAWPMPGTLDRLPLGLGGGPPDANGFSRLLIGLWRWQGNGFSLLSFDRSILEGAIQSLDAVPVADQAQARVRVADFTGTLLGGWLNSYWYRRGYIASVGNAQLLESLQQQLKLSNEETVPMAERLLDAKLQCPLGGNYGPVKSSNPQTFAVWHSDAWPADTTSLAQIEPPPTYSAPWMGWFRGGQAHLTQTDDRVVLLAQLELQQVPEKEGPKQPIELPKMDFNLFSAPLKIFGGSSKKPAEVDNAPKSENNK